MKPLVYWNHEGFEISSYKYSLRERINKTHTTSGNDNTKLCTYTYNDLGFRGDSVKKEGFKVMSLGCSITEGVGVNDNETWPSQFCSHIENGVNLNFGTGGRSNDFICRCLMSYYDLINPDLVLIMYTGMSRREIYTKDGGIEPFMSTGAWGYLKDTDEGVEVQENLVNLQNDNQDFINWYKNHLLVKYFLESKKCNWLWNGSFQTPKEYVDDTNRYDGEYGMPFINFGADGIHPGSRHNKTYAHKLHNHITNNFPHYLNFLPKNTQNLI